MTAIRLVVATDHALHRSRNRLRMREIESLLGRLAAKREAVAAAGDAVLRGAGGRP